MYRFSLFLYGKIFSLIRIFNKNAIKYNPKEFEMLTDLHRGQSGEQLYEKYAATNITRLIIALSVSIIICTAALISSARSDVSASIGRPKFGAADTRKTVGVTIDGSRFSIPVDIKSGLLTFDEALNTIDTLKPDLIRQFLGDNPNLDHVDRPVNLISELGGTDIHIDWTILTPEYINPDGTLQYDNISAAGTQAKLVANITISGHAISSDISPYLFPYIKTPEEILSVEINDYINNDSARTGKTIDLPDTSSLGTIENIAFDETQSQNLPIIFLLALAPPVFALRIGRRKLEKDTRERKEQLARDYPEIVSKLTLLTSAGMSVSNAFQKILKDYDERRSHHGDVHGSRSDILRKCRKHGGNRGDISGIPRQSRRRYVYEEIRLALQKISTGGSEVTAFYEFGRNCSLSCYAKLGALIEQNIVKGSKDFRFLLEQEAANAFEEYKSAFRIKSEQASTKLLIPMIMMLAVIFIIIMVPAFITMSL